MANIINTGSTNKTSFIDAIQESFNIGILSIEFPPKRQTGRHCEGEARSNLLVLCDERFSNDDKSLFGVDSSIGIWNSIPIAINPVFCSGLLIPPPQ